MPSGARILVVDDEIIIARELESRLRSLGYEVPGVAATANEAIALATACRPDLVLMDIVLKGERDGIEAAEEIRRTLQIPVVYVTAYTDPETIARARVTEPFGYVVKPFAERELGAIIEMALYKHQSESRLRLVERWFATAVDAVGDAVIGADAGGNVTIMNPTAEAITCWPRDEAIGRPIDEVLRLVQRRGDAPISRGPVANGPLVCLRTDTWLVDRSGQRTPVDCTLSSTRGQDGDITGMVAVFRDPALQRNSGLFALNADVAIAATQATSLRTMLQLCTDSIVTNMDAALARIWTVNMAGDLLLLQASSGIETNLSGPMARVPIGRSRIGEIARDRRPGFSNEARHDPRFGDVEWAARHGILGFAGYPLLVEDRLIGVLAVYSRHPLAENALDSLGSVGRTIAVGSERKQLEERLRQGQKMEAVGQLAGGIAHDFNNLLTVISGYCQLLISRNAIEENYRYMVNEVTRAVERSASLTRQLLAFSRRQVLEPRVLSLNSLVTDLEKMLRRLIGEDVSLTTALAPALPNVFVDPGQVEQVVMNLVVNARDAMPRGGQLTIGTSVVELDDSFTHLHPDSRGGRFVLLSVSDNGEGMPPDVMARIFEPFFTTKGPGKGTGLGLATVYGIVQQSNGFIGVYSEPGIGTTFKVYLPLADSPGSTPVLSTGPAGEPRGLETILLVEDEDAVRRLTLEILSGLGYNVLTAANGAEAIDAGTSYSGAIHLLLTDIVMPGFSGRELAEWIVSARPGTRVLFMSGYTDDDVIRHGVLSHETQFLGKPFTPSTLARKVREALDVPEGRPSGEGSA